MDSYKSVDYGDGVHQAERIASVSAVTFLRKSGTHINNKKGHRYGILLTWCGKRDAPHGFKSAFRSKIKNDQK